MLIFFDVFMNNLWFGVGGLVALLSICFYMIARVRVICSKPDDDQGSESNGLLHSFALVMLVYMQRGFTTIGRKRLSTR